jgi:hypothetical protein
MLAEDYKVFDRLAHDMHHVARGPLGWVQIYLRTKKGLVFDEGCNLVSAQGREFVAQKVFNIPRPGTPLVDLRSYNVSHFAVGQGGSIVTGSPPSVTLNGPYICDIHLITSISLGQSDYLTEPSGTATAVKNITANGGSLILESASYTGGGLLCTSFTKMKCTCIIPSGEPTSLAAGDAVKIDEAGLYFVNNTVNPSILPNLFSHICFAPKWKEKESDLTIVWYILF